ncbi:MAG: Holliday junction branch migration DNA helicase RuvB, partial [Clostridia bacterium]|nr:Holliday junction branch migration DNA helicase RuvB [Clostridia bacterium]
MSMDMEFDERLLSSRTIKNEDDSESSLRPHRLDEYVGQDKVKENLKIYIEAAKKRGESLDHILLYGP